MWLSNWFFSRHNMHDLHVVVIKSDFFDQKLHFRSQTVDDVEMCRGYDGPQHCRDNEHDFSTFFPARRATHCHSWSVFFLTLECTFGDFELVSKSLFRSIGYRSRIFSQIDAAQPPNCLVSKIISRFVKRFIGKAAHYSMLSKQALRRGGCGVQCCLLRIKRKLLTLDIFAQCKLVHFYRRIPRQWCSSSRRPYFHSLAVLCGK